MYDPLTEQPNASFLLHLHPQRDGRWTVALSDIYGETVQTFERPADLLTFLHNMALLARLPLPLDARPQFSLQ